MGIVFFDGKFVNESEAKVSCFDRGFLFGDGVYATIQVRDGKPFFLNIHLERIKAQSKIFNLEVREIQKEWIEELIRKNQAEKGIWKMKIIVTGGSDHEMSLPKNRKGHLIMTLKPFTPAPYEPMSLTHYPEPIRTPFFSFKTLAHLSRYYVMQWAKTKGVDDALTHDENGFLCEAAFGNICWVKEKTFYTPDPALPLHFGVTIGEMIAIAKENGFKVEFVKTKKIPKESFVYRVNSMSLLRPIGNIEGETFPRDTSLEHLISHRFFHRASLAHEALAPQQASAHQQV